MSVIDSTGSTLSFPFRVDVTGSLAIVRTPEERVREAIIDILECHPGDRRMLPEYGVADYVFAAVNAGFARRLAFHLKQQILDYVPDVESVEVEVEATDASQVEVSIRYTLRSGSFIGFVYPLWQLRQPAAV